MISEHRSSAGSSSAPLLILFIIGIVVTFIFLLHGCLSKHDEYSISSIAESFSTPKGMVITFLKCHFNVNSYSSSNGTTSISGSNRYYLETRDAATLELINCTKLKRPEKDKRQQPYLIGRDDHLVWIYYGELLGIDPISHSVVCSADTIASRSAALKSMLPEESQYYRYDYSLDRLVVTARNALKYVINDDFTVTPLDEVLPGEMNDFPEFRQMQEASELFREKRWDRSFPKAELIRLSDSIKALKLIIDHKNDSLEQFKKQLARRPREAKKEYSFRYDMLTKGTVIDSLLFALEPQQPDNERYFSFSSASTNDVRNHLYRCTYTKTREHRGKLSSVESGYWEPVAPKQSFLNGGFLVNSETRQPIRLDQPSGWLICGSTEVGRESPILLTRISDEGDILWSTNVPAAAFRDMNVTDTGLILYVEHDKRLDEDHQSDIIYRIDLASGTLIQSDVRALRLNS
jgi:hypothetical protein